MFISNGNGGMTYIPTSSSSSSRKREEPKCPHCETELKGWYEPSEPTGKEILLGFVVIALIIANLVAALDGFLEANYRRCEPLLSKRYHFVVPSHPAACAASRWLNNEKEIFRPKEL